VKSVEPLPKLAEWERQLPDNLYVPVGPDTRGVPKASPKPSPRPSVDNGGADSLEPDRGPILFMSGQQIVGNTLLVRFSSDGPTADVINQVYGTKVVGKTSDDLVRLTLPPGMTPMVAARVFQLCPWVSQAEPSYGR
jgi:hypothetical protein